MTDGNAKSLLVSIITPCWNAERFITECYESICAQSYESWEWIVSDDGSTDRSVEVLKKIAEADPRVRVIEPAKASLPARMRNAAMAVAEGDLFAFLDVDDLFAEGRLKHGVEYLGEHHEVDLVYSWVEEFWEEPGRPPIFWPRIELPDDPLKLLLRKGTFICTSSVMFRRKIYDELGGMSEDPRLRVADDLEFLIAAADHHRFGRVEGRLAKYRVHGSGISREDTFIWNEGLKSELEKNGILSGKYGGYYLSNFYFKRAEKHLGEPEARVRSDFLRAILHDPTYVRRWVGGLSLLMPRKLLIKIYHRLKRSQATIEKDSAFPDGSA